MAEEGPGRDKDEVETTEVTEAGVEEVSHGLNVHVAAGSTSSVWMK